MHEFSLRTASPDDIESLTAFWAIAGENEARPTDSTDATLRLLERDPDAIIVAEHDRTLVGTVIAGWDGWRARLYRLAVHPDNRRRGIGSLVLDAAERRLAMVLESNELGASTWRARGYAPQQEWRRWVRTATPTTIASR